MLVKRGRPYDQEIGHALRLAAEHVMIEEGFSGLTVDGLVSEAGTTRPTFYRRYRNVAHLAFDVIVHRFGTGTDVDTGSLAEDLLQLQRDEVAMFSEPLLRNNLPGLLESVRTDSDIRDLYLEQFVKPRRGAVLRVVEAAIKRGEISGSGFDFGWVCDLLLSPILTRALLPISGALDDQLAHRTALLALDALKGTSST
ncbi:TetR/AcrR family transcriptional regulator [Arthrobacter sp. 2RAF6]|uniref:TetR/AcrR family transcriptional regulator n=1 Tax=Arthrobacter sp. 2RAF6 TaxID=3233002 RepID=UPI003F8E1CAE